MGANKDKTIEAVGYLSATRWNDDDEVVEMMLSTDSEDYYLELESQRLPLLEYIDQEVEIKAAVKQRKKNKEYIVIHAVTVLEEEEDGDEWDDEYDEDEEGADEVNDAEGDDEFVDDAGAFEDEYDKELDDEEYYEDDEDENDEEYEDDEEEDDDEEDDDDDDEDEEDDEDYVPGDYYDDLDDEE